MTSSGRIHSTGLERASKARGLLVLGQHDPLVEYQRQGFDMFQAMQDSVLREAVAYVFNASIQVVDEDGERRRTPPAQLSSAVPKAKSPPPAPSPNAKAREGRPHRPYPCGSGKKCKNCHEASSGSRP